MNAEGNPDSAAVLASLLKRFVADQQHGDLAPLTAYQDAYPGYEELVASHYAAVQSSTGGADEGHEPTPPPEPVTTLGPYRILRELGRGGQAVVYLAQDDKLDRRVALKVLNLGAALSDVALRRFRREAELASRLDDPGICPIYDVGSDRGTLWIAMRFVEGETLARKMTAAPPSTRGQVLELVRLIECAARTLHAAHEAGIVHRDVKPGNVMVTPDGQPVILDFGLARDLHAGATVLTQTGGRFGTPQYMSPEQLSGEPSLVDRRTDVWSLGVTLYECLTRHTPFDAPTPERVQSRILSDEPARPGRANASVPRDLEVVLEKALEKDPRRRYPTALAFAEDLARLRTGRPIAARPLPWYGHAVRWARRKPAAATLVVVVALGIPVLSALGGYWLSTRDATAVGAETLRQRETDRLVDEGYFHLLQFTHLRGENADVEKAATRNRFLAALERSPTDALALGGLALTELELFRSDEKSAAAALDVLEERAADFGDDPEFTSMRAYLLRRNGLDDEAAALETTLGHKTGAVRHLMEGIGRLATASVGNLDAGDLAFKSTLSALLLAQRKRLIFYMICVHAAGKSRVNDEVLDSLVAALLDRWSDAPQAWFSVASAYFDRDPQRAVHAIEQAVRLERAYYRAHGMRGFLLFRLGRLPEAKESLRAAIRIHPNYGLARAYLGQIHRIEGDLEGAARELRRAAELYPEWPRSLGWLAGVLREQGNLDGAVDAAQHSIAIDRGDGLGHVELARAYGEQQRFPEAAAEMEIGIATHAPGWAASGCLVELADFYLKAGQPERAEATWRRGLTLTPLHLDECFELVGFLQRTGRQAEIDEVVQAWRRAATATAEAHRDDPTAWRQLAIFRMSKKLDERSWDRSGALAAAQQSVELVGDSAWSPWQFKALERYRFLNTLARALSENDRPAEAVERQREAVECAVRAGCTAEQLEGFRRRFRRYEQQLAK